MIIVEIFVPSVDKTYEFKLNEDVSVSVAIDEISSVICQKEQYAVIGDKSQLMLVRTENRQILYMGLSLYENGVQSGDSLMLV